MLEGFEKYILDRGCGEETAHANYIRALTILGVKERWGCDESERWIKKNYPLKNNPNDQGGYMPSTRNKFRQTFNHLSFFLRWGWQDQKLKKEKEFWKEKDELSLSEWKEFFWLDTQPHWNLLIRLSISTGARPSEIRKLKMEDVDLARRIILIEHKTYKKTRKKRRLIIREFLVEEFKKYCESERIKKGDFVFGSKFNHGQPYSMKALHKEFDKRLAIMGCEKNITPYCGRHAYFTRMAAEVSVFELKDLGGHANITTTEKYVHNNEFILTKAAEKDPLFEEFLDLKPQADLICKRLDQFIENPRVSGKFIRIAQTYIYKAIECGR